jgi:hypothetical protein
VSEQFEPGWLVATLEHNRRRWKVVNAGMNGSEELISELLSVIDRAAEHPTSPAAPASAGGGHP